MLVDTDVLIAYFRGKKHAKDVIDKLGPFSISAVVHMELLQGIRNKDELRRLKGFLTERAVHVLSLDEDITFRAISFLERFSLSHSLKMADALIAATADVRGEVLLTGNYADHKMISDLEIQRFKHI